MNGINPNSNVFYTLEVNFDDGFGKPHKLETFDAHVAAREYCGMMMINSIYGHYPSNAEEWLTFSRCLDDGLGRRYFEYCLAAIKACYPQ